MFYALPSPIYLHSRLPLDALMFIRIGLTAAPAWFAFQQTGLKSWPYSLPKDYKTKIRFTRAATNCLSPDDRIVRRPRPHSFDDKYSSSSPGTCYSTGYRLTSGQNIMRTASPIWDRPFFWGIKRWQFACVLLLYLFFGAMYWLSYFILGANNIKEMTADYILKGLLSLPLWYLYFKYWKHTPLQKKLFFHLITCPLYVFTWYHLHHALMRTLGWSYLAGGAAIWDIYLPTLFYIAQFSIYHVYSYWLELKHQKIREQDLMQVAYQSEISALKAQIQPHFLFNTLNSISASIPVEAEKSRILISKLADTFRYSLQASEEETITLEEELKFLSSYLDLEQERFKSRLQVKLSVDDNLLHLRFPPMLLQPLVENAIKHGVSPKASGGQVQVSVVHRGQMAIIEVSDTGVGYAGVDLSTLFTKGIGLRNTALRIRRLYNEEIKVTHNQPTGLTVAFRVPIYQTYG